MFLINLKILGAVMNEKDIAEIRRRYRTDKNNISKIVCAYVNEKQEIVSISNISVGEMTVDETDSVFSVFRKMFSGEGKKFIDVSIPPKNVPDGETYKTLDTLRKTMIKDDDAVKELFTRIATSYKTDGDFMILLTAERYDVFNFTKDGEQEEESTEVFDYIVCCVCPMKKTKSALMFDAPESRFCNVALKSLISAPEWGFMFPAFERRKANIYSVGYYTRDLKDNRPEVAAAVFESNIPMPAADQKKTFGAVLSQAIDKDCSLDVVQNVHSQFCELISEHKQSKDTEPLTVSKGAVKRLLRAGGVPEERIEDFGNTFDREFGSATELRPKNIVDEKKFEVTTADVSVKVAPEKKELVSTRVIDGVKYILIRADTGVEVNGVNINISEED